MLTQQKILLNLLKILLMLQKKLLTLLSVIIGALALRSFIVEPTIVDGESMQTTLMDGERVLVEKVSYWFNEPQRGDIVIVRFPNRNECFVKRIIAFGGETIEIRDGFVYIDGKMLDETEYAGEWYGKIRPSMRVVNFGTNLVSGFRAK